jgi:hypothetical protein
MKSRPNQLQEQREDLLLRCRIERMLLTAQTQEIQQKLSIASLAWRTLGKVKEHPTIALGSFALIAVLKPRRMLALAKNALVAWQLWQRFAPMLRNLSKGASSDNGARRSDKQS